MFSLVAPLYLPTLITDVFAGVSELVFQLIIIGLVSHYSKSILISIQLKFSKIIMCFIKIFLLLTYCKNITLNCAALTRGITALYNKLKTTKQNNDDDD